MTAGRRPLSGRVRPAGRGEIVHEFAVAQSLIEVATEAAARAGAARVTRLHCRIGALRQVDEWLLREAFEMARAGTTCDAAELCVEKTHLRLRCPACRAGFELHDWDWSCPRCGAEGIDPAGGDELELVRLEAEVPCEHQRIAECV